MEQNCTQRQRAARERAARERQQRIEEAMRECEELQKQREATAKQSGRKVNEARASTTDPQARNMKFSDGGCRPGYNVQFATDTASGVIVGVEVTNAGNDGEQLPPMLDQLEERYERVPDEALGRWWLRDDRDNRSGRLSVAAPCTRRSKTRRSKKRREKIPMPARNGTAMRPPRGGAGWGPRQRNQSIGCGPRQRSGSTRSVATAASGTCPYAVNRDVVSSHCCLQLLIISLSGRDSAPEAAQTAV